MLRLEHRPDDGDKQDWPFAFDAEQNISLGTSGFECRIVGGQSAMNSPAPLGLGLHPFFPAARRRNADLRRSGRVAQRPGYVAATQVSGGLWDHAAGQAVGAQELDQ